jgi:hypothetical protein
MWSKDKGASSMFDKKNFRLAEGRHLSPEEGLCFMEAVAFLAGNPHSDLPQCACPVFANFGRVINDALDDQSRDEFLIPLIPMLIDTKTAQSPRQGATPEEEARGKDFARWALQEIAPEVLRGTVAGRCASILRTSDSLLNAEELLCAAHDTLLEADASAATVQSIGYIIEASRAARYGTPEKSGRYAAHAASLLAQLKWHQAFGAAMARGAHPRWVAKESAAARRSTWAHSVQFFWSQIVAAQPVGSTPASSPVSRGPAWRPPAP